MQPTRVLHERALPGHGQSQEQRVEARIVEAARMANAAEGISVCPEAATCVLAIEKLLADGWLDPADRVVLFNTGAAIKYVETVTLDLPVITDAGEVDYAMFT